MSGEKATYPNTNMLVKFTNSFSLLEMQNMIPRNNKWLGKIEMQEKERERERERDDIWDWVKKREIGMIERQIKQMKKQPTHWEIDNNSYDSFHIELRITILHVFLAKCVNRVMLNKQLVPY